MDFTPHPYPEEYTQQGEAKRRRRRKSECVSRKRNLSLEQANLLELSFGSERKLDSERKERIAADLGLDPRQVAVWFQNRRARWRTKNLEDDYSKLKSIHGDALLHKCSLESQVMELKERLAEAEREIRRLSVAGNSPSSSQSVDVTSFQEQQFFGIQGLDDVFYDKAVQDYVYGYDLWS